MPFFFCCCTSELAVNKSLEDPLTLTIERNPSSIDEGIVQWGEVCEPTPSQEYGKPFVDAISETASTAFTETETASTGFPETFTENGYTTGDLRHELGLSPSVSGSETPTSIIEVAKHREIVTRPRRADWWDEAEMQNVKGMHNAIHITKLLEACVVKHAEDQKRIDTWYLEQAKKIIGDLDLNASGKDVVSVWLNLGSSSLMFACEVIDKARLRTCLANDPLAKRLKLVINPVQVKLPFPAKGPKDAETIGSFFGKSAWLQCSETGNGGELVNVRIDIFSKWLLRMALQKAGFRRGNVIEIILVDWAGSNEQPGVLASCRLSVTEDYVNLLA